MMHVMNEAQEMSLSPEWEHIPMIGLLMRTIRVLTVVLVMMAVALFAFYSLFGAAISCSDRAVMFFAPVSGILLDIN